MLLASRLEDDPHKLRQAEAHDSAGSERFERTRPLGAPRFYGMLMEEKLSRSISELRGRLSGSSAVVVCAGSGMDAEYLARNGIPTIAVDVSLGSCRRTLDRADRAGLPILPVAGDAEQLPLRDASVGLAYVHDGLHHLRDYFRGLGEMLRVARGAVSISEPTRAAATAVLVRVGVSAEVEDSGNSVHRVPVEDVVDFVQARGFESLRADRYAMYYRHQPGPVVSLLSRPRLASLGMRAFRAANRIAGPAGNKMAVQAVRAPHHSG